MCDRENDIYSKKIKKCENLKLAVTSSRPLGSHEEVGYEFYKSIIKIVINLPWTYQKLPSKVEHFG